MTSSDGKLSIFNLENYWLGTGPSSIQALSILSDLPPWLHQVGQAYRVNIEQAIAGAVVLHYIQRDAPPGFEHTLGIYFKPDRDGARWQRLATELDQRENTATTRMPADSQGNGIYALVASLELPPLQEGWNLLSYPLPTRQPISTVLSSVAPSYTVVYEYDELEDPAWRVFAPSLDEATAAIAQQANDLTTARFGRTYLVFATDVVTPYLPVEVSTALTDVVASVRVPDVVAVPAVMVGRQLRVARDPDSASGVRVEAWIDETLCGVGPVSLESGSWTWLVHVAADAVERGCGQAGRTAAVWLVESASGSAKPAARIRLLAESPWQNTGINVTDATVP